MRTFALLAGLAALGVALLVDNWHPVRAIAYAVGWALAAAILLASRRRAAG
ncbi:hypothetical protein ACFVVM_08270 [Nocardia sp. NPDC058176]|uniref:hypothetical protein n=1 Tax=Nocardia sp. NPDC058176 TaxID=3346368 RepID=UPI0036DB93E4